MKHFYFIIVLLFTITQLSFSQDTLYTAPEGDYEEYDEYEDNYISEDYENEENELSPNRVFLFGIELSFMQPLDQFFVHNQNVNFGFGLNFLTQLKKDKGLMVGLNVAYNPIEVKNDDFSEIIDGEWRDLSYTTSTHMYTLLINVRHYFDVYWGNFSPYVEGLAGGKILSTSTVITDYDDDDYTENENHKFDFSPSFGIGAGLHYKVKDHGFIDVNLRFVPGSRSTYYILDDSFNDSYIGIDNYSLTVSKTNSIFYNAGFTFKF